jgi:hypothetical protein
MPIPDFDLLAREFPDYWKYPDPAEVRKMIGGGVNDKDITNTCTIRLSHAMNAAGATIPRIWQTVTNRRGKNGQYYIIRVVNFRPWMAFQFGEPDYDFVKKPGDAFDRGRIKGAQGVIGFDIGFGDATGHFDLWYMDKFSHEHNGGGQYFTRASRISLWSTGIRTMSPEV